MISRLISVLKREQFSFQGRAGFLSWRSTSRIQILFNEGLFLKIERSKILLDQGEQLLIGWAKIFQAFNSQDYLIVQIGVAL